MARPVGRKGETRERVLAAALDLFAEHGVGGTSLQMIADRIGVTKAAVYYLFPTKGDIVLAVLQPAFDQMDELLVRAEAATTPTRRSEIVVEGLVDLVLDHRRIMAALQGDPGIAAVLQTHPPTLQQTDRISDALLGPDPDPSARVAASLFGGGLMFIGTDPRMRDLERDVLRRELMAAARRLLLPATT